MRFYGPSPAFYGENPDATAFFDATYASSTLVPDTYNISLDGRNYMVDLSQPFYRQLRRQLEPLIRTQADTSNEPGEQTMDPNGLWRRSYEDWRLGAGQRYLDRNTSQDNAYWTSKGVDTITTAWQVSLLPATFLAGSSGQTIPQNGTCVAGGYLYFLEGTAGIFRTPISNLTAGSTPTFTQVTGLPVDASSICSDGFNVYAACGTNGIYISASSGTTFSTYVTASIGTTNLIGYANGRLMLWSTVSGSSDLYNITTSGSSLPTALQTFDNPQTVVTGFASGNNYLYIITNAGASFSAIYGTQTTADGTTLQPPIVQTAMPVGEVAESALGYLGYLVVGTSLGVRVCQQGATGVTIGTLIPTTSPVLCLSPYASFVYFGWTNYDGTDTGLGKISLENFVVNGLLPAYQSDRMAASVQGPVTSVNAFSGVVLFSVGGGSGLYMDAAQLVPSGTVQSGYILYDLTDPKVPALLDVQGAAVQEFGTYTVALSIDGNSFELVGNAGPGSLVTNTFQLQNGGGSRFEILLTLQRDGTTTTEGPTITRWTLRSYPAPLRPKTWQLPLVLNEHIINASESAQYFDPEVEINALEAMANNGIPVIYQEGNESYLVFVTDVQFIARNLTEDKHYYNGLALVNIQSIPVPTSQYL